MKVDNVPFAWRDKAWGAAWKKAEQLSMRGYGGDMGAVIDAAIAAVAPLIRAAERERCHEIALHEHLAATHDDEDDGNTNLVARFKSQGAADGAARIMAAIRAMPDDGGDAHLPRHDRRSTGAER